MTTVTVAQLRVLIPSILADNPLPETIREFVYCCRNMAAAYLRVKISRGRLDPAMFGVSLDDLALDCVADLFERDRVGRFVELESYYRPITTLFTSEEMWFGATRRLIFSKVNEGLFELYRDHDRSLSNVIRNLKIGLRSHRGLFTFERNGEVWVRTADQPNGAGVFPLIPSEMVEAHLLASTDRQRNVRDLLDAFADLLQTQGIYRRQYPLIGLALVCRSVLQRADPVIDAIAIDPSGLTTEEVQEFMDASVERVQSLMKHSYIEKGKLDEPLYDLYFDSIRDILNNEFVRNDGIRASYYQILKARIPKLTEEDYTDKHRTYLEYLAKLARKEFLESISHELKIATKLH